MDKDTTNPSAALMELINGFRVSQAIHVAATLGIADLLKEGPRRSDDLAAATGTHADRLYRLLRALASVGVSREDADRRFALTALGDCLRSDAAEPLRSWAVHIGRPEFRAPGTICSTASVPGKTLGGTSMGRARGSTAPAIPRPVQYSTEP